MERKWVKNIDTNVDVDDDDYNNKWWENIHVAMGKMPNIILKNK